MIYKNLSVNGKGHLSLGGIDCQCLADKHGTPLYVLDEDIIRENALSYVEALKKYAPKGSMPFFASKACSFKHIYRIISSCGMGTDLVSPGEIYTAISIGFDMSKSIFHGNCKTDSDISYAIDSKVGYFVTDTFEELEALNRIAGEKNIKQKVLLRLTPGIDVHTHAYISTGNIDSKFGFPIVSDDVKKAIEITEKCENLILSGFHCHIGSQIFELESFTKAADIMLAFIAENKPDCEILNIGGGFGVAYKAGEESVNIDLSISELCKHIKDVCQRYSINMPKLFMEPGRSIVASAGTTLYTVGSVKIIPGVKNYVAIDGGMADNPRYALYRSDYTCFNALKMNETADFECTIAGRCCESGDLIQENVTIPKPKRGSIIAVCGTGAYNFSMSSNYNRLCRPPVVMISNGNEKTVVKRESFEHLTANEE